MLDEFGNLIDDQGQVLREAPGAGRSLVPTNNHDAIASLVNEDKMPIHIRKMQELNITSDVMSSFVGVPWRSVKPYLNKTVKVVGAIIYFSGPYKAKDDEDDAPLREGYHTVLLKLDEVEVIKDVPINRKLYDIKYNVVLKISSKKIAELVLALIAMHGWYDWPEGVSETMIFTGDEQSGYTARSFGDIAKYAVEVTEGKGR